MRAARRRPKNARVFEKRRRRSTNGNESDVMRIVFWTCVLLLSAGFGIFSQVGERKPSAAKFKSNISPSKAKDTRYQKEKDAASHMANVHNPLQHGMDGIREGGIMAVPFQPIRNGYAEEQFEPKPWKPGIASKVAGRDSMGHGEKWKGDEPAGPPQPIRNGDGEQKFEPKPWKPGRASQVGRKDNNGEDGLFGIGGDGGGGSEGGEEPGDSERPGPESEDAFGYRDPADAVELTYSVGSGEAGPMEKFLSEGKKLPVVLLTCNRAALLEQTIKSLRQVRGIDMDKVMVLQDGSDSQVAAVVEAQGLYLKQNTAVPSLRGGPNAGNGAARIAMHYKFSLDHAFKRDPEAPGVIIVEDDLLLSPDFLEYFEANAPVLERDSNTLVLSAWNDNGYKGRVSNKSELKRTAYFPGLGWLLSRQLYEELRPRWPREHWDHWLRNSNQHRGRECVFPEVPRTYHNGIKGTFMNQEMHDSLFKDIDYNTDASFKWPSPTAVRPVGVPPPYAQALRENYERRMEARIRAARHINDLDDLPQNSSKGKKESGGGGEIVFWYSLGRGQRGAKEPPFSAFSKFFGIWHEYERTEHNGMHSFRYDGDSHVMLINTAQSSYVNLKPTGLIPATMDHLRGLGSAGGHQDGRRALQTVPADEPNVSCDVVCAAKNMECFQQGFSMLNFCSILIESFPCSRCLESYGSDQPCYVEEGAPVSNFPGECLVSSNPFDSTCSAKHELTRRICPCVSSG